MTEVRGVIYDCDGVLFDSRRANLAFYGRVFEHFGEASPIEEDSPQADVCHTYASADVFRMLLGHAKVAQALDFAATIDPRSLVSLMIPEEGMPEVLRFLAGNMKLALATNRGHSVRHILDHFCLTPYFSKVVTCQDVQHPKPSPDMLLAAVEGLGLTPEQVLFVGDSVLDRQAARNAGVKFVAYKGLVESELVIEEHWELISLLGLSEGKPDSHDFLEKA